MVALYSQPCPQDSLEVLEEGNVTLSSEYSLRLQRPTVRGFAGMFDLFKLMGGFSLTDIFQKRLI